SEVLNQVGWRRPFLGRPGVAGARGGSQDEHGDGAHEPAPGGPERAGPRTIRLTGTEARTRVSRRPDTAGGLRIMPTRMLFGSPSMRAHESAPVPDDVRPGNRPPRRTGLSLVQRGIPLSAISKARRPPDHA